MKVLVADDEVVSRRLIESSVRRWGYEPVVASDGLEAAQILRRSDAPKLVVLDWMMPGLDGIEICRELRRDKVDSYVYILLLTSKHAMSDVVAGLEAGADDYITKPFNPQELRMRLRAGKRLLYLLDQITTARDTLRELAARDPLTGLWNHSSIIELLNDEIHRAERQETHLGVALLDLDRFKLINDTHGHLVGDHVLREASKVITGCVRPYDAVGRLGGEEFLLVLPGCDQINAVSHAERVRLALHRASVKTPAGILHFTASIGVACVDPHLGIDAPTAIQTADAAMYAAKRAGRNLVEFRAAALVPTPV